jgi:hypothetical protein
MLVASTAMNDQIARYLDSLFGLEPSYALFWHTRPACLSAFLARAS